MPLPAFLLVAAKLAAVLLVSVNPGVRRSYRTIEDFFFQIIDLESERFIDYREVFLSSDAAFVLVLCSTQEPGTPGEFRDQDDAGRLAPTTRRTAAAAEAQKRRQKRRLIAELQARESAFEVAPGRYAVMQRRNEEMHAESAELGYILLPKERSGPTIPRLVASIRDNRTGKRFYSLLLILEHIGGNIEKLRDIANRVTSIAPPAAERSPA
jgi:hypothetical protein